MEKEYYGERLRQARLSQGLTLEAVAAETGISASYISKIERNKANLTMGYLRQLAAFYGLPLVSLMHQQENRSSAVVRKGDGATIEAGGVRLRLLRQLSEGQMEPIIGEHGPHSKSGTLYTHSGEEFKYILRGQLHYFVGDQQVLLKEGDSIYHDATVPHGWENRTDRVTLVLSVVTPASFLY